ncbi:abortive infection system antitoxin AbiGi family protein [Aquiflexum gelatinilyticum]|uniref:Abortive infection system antitoxin AbiGi family protein n=1 Tax=Aquiflexum gelatinilyticum TaxID=2961943 RepID=A0A9X2SYM1_9BACT|nr:abortive infection system antitoxin AbiGi family protein [Aquiflexum gelatinilyticum]MCR9015334.1 abortive infection system antitoxin AbiGi family protein [Aquiflexum gelatinilyticum]
MGSHFENLSSNTLFHFTGSLKNLTGILASTFLPRYCLEVPNFFKKIPFNSNLAYPMVCFCDIPLSKVKRHIGLYGNYGIGLSKEWAIKNNLSPVIYTRKNAKTANTIENLISWFDSIQEKLSEDDKFIFRKSYSELLMHLKPYYGNMIKDGKIIKKRFYDEREWRWIPELDPKLFRSHLLKDEFNDQNIKEVENKKIAVFRKLNFKPEDIRYLIINNDDEIDSFIQDLESIKVNFNSRAIKKLTSRIITNDQIIKDF